MENSKRNLFIFIFSFFLSTVGLYAQCTSFNLPDDFGCVDQGETLTVAWTSVGCPAGEEISLSLIDVGANSTAASWTALPNSGSFTITLSGTLTPGNYQFYIQNDPWPPDAWGYGIIFEVKAVVVPVVWESFTCYENADGNVNLEWSTQTEINNRGFEIQRSSDAKQWNIINFESARANDFSGASYIYTDRSPQNGQNFYRLKQIDFDGQFDYSVVSQINLRQTKNVSIHVFPNPSSSYLMLNRSFENDTPYFISNINGQIVFRGKLNSEIVNVHFLSSGSYQLLIQEGKKNFVSNFVKE